MYAIHHQNYILLVTLLSYHFIAFTFTMAEAYCWSSVHAIFAHTSLVSIMLARIIRKTLTFYSCVCVCGVDVRV